MDPLTMIVSALATGAASALSPTAAQVVKDAYSGVKNLIVRKYAFIDLKPIEQKPESQPKRDSLQEDLGSAGADKDAELLQQVVKLIAILETQAPETAAAIGIDLQSVKAASLKIGKVISEGSGVKIKDGEFSGDIVVGEVRAGRGTSNP